MSPSEREHFPISGPTHHKTGGLSGDPSRLQRIATAIFVTGFASSVAGTRIMAPLNGAVGRLGVQQIGRNHTLYSGDAQRHGTPLELQQTRELLVQLQALLHSPPVALNANETNVQARAREITRSLALIDRAVDQATRNDAKSAPLGMCAAPADEAFAFVSTNATYVNGGAGSLSIEIGGNEGVQQFSFASGTTQSNIIAAINRFTKATGVEAEQGILSAGRIQLTSVNTGVDSLVRLRVLDGPDLIYAEPTGGQGVGILKDYGTNALMLKAIDEKP